MKIDKEELANKLAKVKNVVPSRTTIPVLQNVLLSNGYLTATDTQLALQVILEGSEGERMLIPSSAFDLISSLPDGEIDISNDDPRQLMVRNDMMNVSYAVQEIDDFPAVEWTDKDATNASVDAQKFQRCLKSVSYAMGRTANRMMDSVNLSCENGKLSFAALDGRQIAWDETSYEGKFEMSIPRNAVATLIRLDLKGEMQITLSKTAASFRTKEYIISTSLLEGAFFQYQKLFPADTPINATVNRAEFLDAVSRAGMCADKMKPIVLEFSGEHVKITSRGAHTDYGEYVGLLDEIEHPIKIGIDPNLLRTAVNNFTMGEVHIGLIGPKNPVIMTEEGSSLKELLLPVNIGA